MGSVFMYAIQPSCVSNDAFGVDLWYAVDDTSARPASLVDRIEARWKGSVLYSQETKKRLFGAGKTKNERTRTGVVVSVLSPSHGWMILNRM